MFASALIDTLSPREKQVLYLVGQAKTNKEIARDLSMSPRTVEIHLTKIKGKTMVKNKIAMALLAHGIEL